MNNFSQLKPAIKEATVAVRAAVHRFIEIDGALFAAGFAHYAFLAFFPLIILAVTIASVVIDRDRAATTIIQYVEAYIPIGVERRTYIFEIVSDVIQGRGKAGAIAFLLLLWAASRFLTTLIRATNRAWGADSYRWWRLPGKSLRFFFLLAAVASLGIVLPVALRLAQSLAFQENIFSPWIYDTLSYALRFLITFVSLTLFYKFAPRRQTRITEVWPSALATAFLLQFSEAAFAIYLRNFAGLSAIYGAFGSIIALLLWIYVSGCIFILGACLCASSAKHDVKPDGLSSIN